MVSMYLTLMRTSIISQFQYRAATYFYMIGMVVEPIIYLVVWSTIARSHGGEVAGFTPGTFAAYYIVWMLVRNVNIVFTPFGWEWRIKEGNFAVATAEAGASDPLRPRRVRRRKARRDHSVAADRGRPCR